MSWAEQGMKICLPGSAEVRCFVSAHTHMCTHALAHTLQFQMPQVVCVTVNDSDQLHVQLLLQALCLHAHMASGVNFIPAAVVMLQMPRVK